MAVGTITLEKCPVVSIKAEHVHTLRSSISFTEMTKVVQKPFKNQCPWELCTQWTPTGNNLNALQEWIE